MSKIFFSHVNTWLLDYQQSLISMLENEDNHKTFMIDDWSYDEVGSNQTPPRLLQVEVKPVCSVMATFLKVQALIFRR